MGNWYIDDDGTVVLKLAPSSKKDDDTVSLKLKPRNGLYICGKPDNFDIMFGDNKLGECLYEDSNAYPFIIGDGKLYVGESAEGHWDIGRQVAGIPYDKFFDYNLTPKERYALEVKRDAAVGELQSYNDYAAGRIWVNVDADYDLLYGSNIISFWDSLKYDTIVKESMVEKVVEYFGIDHNNIYIAIIDNYDDSFGKLVKYTGGDLNLSKMNDEQQEYYATHLMNAKAKHNATSDFRNTRDKAIYAPREKATGTLAGYHAMRYPYGESKKSIKVNITENQYKRLFLI